MPFNDSTVVGFYLSLTIQTLAGYSIMLSMMTAVLFYLGFYFYVVAFITDFESILAKTIEADGLRVKYKKMLIHKQIIIEAINHQIAVVR